jgi:voltage-gated potassium channel Kch
MIGIVSSKLIPDQASNPFWFALHLFFVFSAFSFVYIALATPSRSIALLSACAVFPFYLATFVIAYDQLGLYQTYVPPGEKITEPIHSVFISIYFSLTTLTTVGFGDYIPDGTSCRVYAAFEAVSGFFLLALLVSVFLRVLTLNPAARKN